MQNTAAPAEREPKEETTHDRFRPGDADGLPAGERVRAELGFDWEGELTAVTAHFRRFVGSRFSARHLEPGISLVGKEPRRVVEGEEAYISVELEGVIPGSIDPGI